MQRVMGASEVGRDPVISQVRCCGRCEKGLMSCVKLVEYWVNRKNTGREYTFRCRDCGYEFLNASHSRMRRSHSQLIVGLVLGCGLLLFGGWKTFLLYQKGGPTSPTFAMLPGLLLGMGSLLGAYVFWGLFSRWVGWRRRLRSPLAGELGEAMADFEECTKLVSSTGLFSQPSRETGAGRFSSFFAFAPEQEPALTAIGFILGPLVGVCVVGIPIMWGDATQHPVTTAILLLFILGPMACVFVWQSYQNRKLDRLGNTQGADRESQ